MSDIPPNVVRLPVITRLELDADMVLREAIGKFDKKKLLEIPETWDGETHKRPDDPA